MEILAQQTVVIFHQLSNPLVSMKPKEMGYEKGMTAKRGVGLQKTTIR
jgi:hypothetical protein